MTSLLPRRVTLQDIPIFSSKSLQFVSLLSATNLPSFLLASSSASSSTPSLSPTRSFAQKIVQNRAKTGLFAGKHIRFGNQVSHSHRKTRRTWEPNIQFHNFYSDLLKEKFHIRVTTHALKCIDKKGGFDNYILKTNKHHLGEGFALEVRDRLIAAVKQARREDYARKQAEKEKAASENENTFNSTPSSISATSNATLST